MSLNYEERLSILETQLKVLNSTLNSQEIKINSLEALSKNLIFLHEDIKASLREIKALTNLLLEK